MNKKVMRSMVILLWVFLLGFAVIKLFFAEGLIAAVGNQRIEYIGNIIDNNIVLKIFFETLLGAFAMHFYLCACKQTWKLSVKEYIMVAVYSVAVTLIKFWLPQIATFINLAAPIAIPIILKCNWKQVTIIFILHHLGQLLTLFIRSKELYLVNTNSATTLILTLDVYVWLCLYYSYANLYKEETLWDYLSSHFSAIRRKLSLRKNLKE